MVVQTEQEPQTAGELIRFWRTQRRSSQLELSLDANVSTKHLSFVETGRSSPSRQLLVHLAQHLDLPIGERNRLLLAGGFAPPYLEQPYDGEVMKPLRESLSRLLEAHEPNPALIVDGLWNLIEANRAASLLWDGVDPELLEPPINMLRLGVHPGGLPRISSMTAACNAPLIHRLKRRSREDADPALAKLIEEVESYLPDDPPAGHATQPVVSLDLRTPLGEVRLFTVIATLGAPLEVTAASLAIETFVPMDAKRSAAWRTRSSALTEGVYGTGDDEKHHCVGDQRLKGHEPLGPRRQRHRVRRADRDRIGKRHIEVVAQPWAPAGSRNCVLRELEVDVTPLSLCAEARSALVQLPEQQPEGDDVAEPDDRPVAQQFAGAEARRAAAREGDEQHSDGERIGGDQEPE